MEAQVAALVRCNKNDKPLLSRLQMKRRIAAIRARYENDMKQLRFEARLALKPAVFKGTRNTYYIHRTRGPLAQTPRNIPCRFTPHEHISSRLGWLGAPTNHKFLTYDPETDTAVLTLPNRGVDIVLGTDDSDEVEVLEVLESPKPNSISTAQSREVDDDFVISPSGLATLGMEALRRSARTRSSSTRTIVRVYNIFFFAKTKHVKHQRVGASADGLGRLCARRRLAWPRRVTRSTGTAHRPPPL